MQAQEGAKVQAAKARKEQQRKEKERAANLKRKGRKKEKNNEKTAADFYRMHAQQRAFASWKAYAIAEKQERLNEQNMASIADSLYQKQQLRKTFKQWQAKIRYLQQEHTAQKFYTTRIQPQQLKQMLVAWKELAQQQKQYQAERDAQILHNIHYWDKFRPIYEEPDDLRYFLIYLQLN